MNGTVLRRKSDRLAVGVQGVGIDLGKQDLRVRTARPVSWPGFRGRNRHLAARRGIHAAFVYGTHIGCTLSVGEQLARGRDAENAAVVLNPGKKDIGMFCSAPVRY